MVCSGICLFSDVTNRYVSIGIRDMDSIESYDIKLRTYYVYLRYSTNTLQIQIARIHPHPPSIHPGIYMDAWSWNSL